MKKYMYFFIILLTLLTAIQTQLCSPFWDWFGYHYYNGWAFLNHRLDIDIMPNFHRTYFNPLLDSITYFLIKHLNNHPYIFLAISALKFVVFTFLSYLIFNLVYNKESKSRDLTICFSIFILVLSPILLLVNSFDFVDIQIGIITLLGLYLFLKTFYCEDEKKNLILIFAGSFFLGAACGLKYTNISFCLALPIAVLIVKLYNRAPVVKTLIVLISGMLSGFLLTDGFWLYAIWNKFHNPLFPYFNNIFHSPYADFSQILNDDFYQVKPKNIWELIFSPILLFGFEDRFLDPKYILAFFISIIFMLMFAFNKKYIEKIQCIIKPDVLLFLVFYTAIVFYINISIFGGYRYIIALYCTSIVIITSFIYYIVTFFKKNLYTAFIVTFLFLYSIFMYNPITSIYIQKYMVRPLKNVIGAQDLKFEDGANVFIANYLSAYLIPDQNPKANYIAFVVPKKIRRQYHSFHEKFCKNMFYLSDYLEELLPEKIKEDKPTYIVFSAHAIGYRQEDFPIFRDALNYYSGIKLYNLDYCKTYPLHVTRHENMFPGPLYVCKLK